MGLGSLNVPRLLIEISNIIRYRMDSVAANRVTDLDTR